MGAHNFEIHANGHDMADAYDRAWRQAKDEYGYDPYNGTISTTNGYLDLDHLFPKGTKATTKVKLADFANTYMPEYDTKGYKKLSPLHRSIVDMILKQRIEKRGPCGGVSLSKTRFYFFGWAAS